MWGSSGFPIAQVSLWKWACILFCNPMLSPAPRRECESIQLFKMKCPHLENMEILERPGESLLHCAIFPVHRRGDPVPQEALSSLPPPPLELLSQRPLCWIPYALSGRFSSLPTPRYEHFLFFVRPTLYRNCITPSWPLSPLLLIDNPGVTF